MEHAELLRMFADAPVVKFVQARLSFEPDGTAVIELPGRDEFLQTARVMHGAMITFAADTSAWFTAAAAAGHTQVTTADFTIHLLRPVRAGVGLRARSTLIKRGARLIVAETKVMTDEGELAAVGLFSHAVLGKKE